MLTPVLSDRSPIMTVAARGFVFRVVIAGLASVVATDCSMLHMLDNNVGDTAKNGLLAAGGVLGAIGASSCCLLPLVFAFTGVSGAWIGSLTPPGPYQPVFIW